MQTPSIVIYTGDIIKGIRLLYEEGYWWGMKYEWKR
jgi:hypothetical protein